MKGELWVKKPHVFIEVKAIARAILENLLFALFGGQCGGGGEIAVVMHALGDGF